MDYRVEYLMPIVTELAEKYTAKESSSISYETARALMEAVLYCIHECGAGAENVVQSSEERSERLLYERGKAIVVQKTYRAKALYEHIIRGFEDYGCRHYRDTIIKGMPHFFMRYDPVFAPGDHLLTLDYPLLCGNPASCGIDCILAYLEGIWVEQNFLATFRPAYIRRLLCRVSPDYETLYLGNICEPVLLAEAGRVIAGAGGGELTGRDLDRIRAAFEGKRMEAAAAFMRQAVEAAVVRRIGGRQLSEAEAETKSRPFGTDWQRAEACRKKEKTGQGDPEYAPEIPEKALAGFAGYFKRAAHGFAARVQHGIEQDCLDVIFGVDEDMR